MSRCAAAAGFLGLLAGLLPTAHGTAAAADARWPALSEELRALQRRHAVPALALVILDRGRPVLISAGSLEDTAPFRPHSPFRWGSISKTVTALTALEAARRQEVALSAPVAELLEPLPYRNPWAAEYPLRLAHLLELTGGLPELTAEEFEDNTPRPLSAALARRAQERFLLWPPGLQHSYTNLAPGITAAVVERITGTSFDEAVAQRVFDPLGMAGASFRPAPGLPGGFRADGRTRIPYWHMTFPAFGALNASPEAMAKLLEALLNQGRVGGTQVVGRSSISRMFRPQASLGAQAGLAIGYGAGLYGWVRGGHLFHGHGGDADGYRSRFGLLREAGRGYLIGINVDDPSLLRRMQRIVEGALTADLAAPSPPAPVSLTPDVLARHAGTYYPASTRFAVARWRSGEAGRVNVGIRNGRLELQRDGRTEALLPVSAAAFRREQDPAASVVFVEHRGVHYMQGELGNFVRIAPGPCADFLPCPTP